MKTTPRNNNNKMTTQIITGSTVTRFQILCNNDPWPTSYEKRNRQKTNMDRPTWSSLQLRLYCLSEQGTDLIFKQNCLVCMHTAIITLDQITMTDSQVFCFSFNSTVSLFRIFLHGSTKRRNSGMLAHQKTKINDKEREMICNYCKLFVMLASVKSKRY